MPNDENFIITMEDISLAIKSIKRTITTTTWWSYVHDEVKEAILDVIDNLSTLAIPFKEAFIAQFKLCHARRILRGINVPSKRPSALFGRSMTEECYQSGISATKNLLEMDDWFRPNDADVQACMFLIQQIEILVNLGIFKEETTSAKSIFHDFQE